MSNDLVVLPTENELAIHATDQQLIDLSERAKDQVLLMLDSKPPVFDLRDTRDNVKAIEAWLLPKAHTRDAKIEARNNLSEAIIRLEREIGLWLKQIEKNKGGDNRPPDIMSGGTEEPTLADMAISYKQSSRWQAMADLPADKLEEHIAVAKENGWELTSSAIERHGRAYRNGTDPKAGKWVEVDSFELLSMSEAYSRLLAAYPNHDCGKRLLITIKEWRLNDNT